MQKSLKDLLQGNDLSPITLHLDGGKKITGLLAECRVRRDEPVEGKYLYDIRHSDNDWCDPATLEHRVMVNWFGTIILDEPVDFPDGQDCIDIEDYSY